MASPLEKSLSLKERAIASRSLSFRSSKRSILRSRSLGAAIEGSLLGREPLRELFDLPLGGLEPARTEAVELLAALPELERLVQLDVAALEPLHDRLQLL